MRYFCYLRSKTYTTKNKLVGYNATLYRQDDATLACTCNQAFIYKNQFRNLLNNGEIFPLNFDNSRVIVRKTFKSREQEFRYIVQRIREYMEDKYGIGTDLAGQCIEASELIAYILNSFGIQAKTVEGWCLYDDMYYGSDVPYDAHTWVEANGFYIDVTADQFNPGMGKENEFPGVIFRRGLPYGMQYDEPVEGVDY